MGQAETGMKFMGGQFGSGQNEVWSQRGAGPAFHSVPAEDDTQPLRRVNVNAQRGTFERGWTWLLSHPVWTGIGAIAGVLAVIAAFVVPMMSKDDSSPQSSSAELGDCSASGINISIDCSQVLNLPKPASVAEIGLDVSWEGYVVWLFDGPVSDLPKPPDYPTDHKGGHCADWGESFLSSSGFYGVGPAILLSATSGQFDQVAITGIKVNVIETKPIPVQGPARTFVECEHGAGLNPGYEVKTDTRNGETTVVANGGGEGGGGEGSNGTDQPVSMPPASISVRDSADSVEIRIWGDPTKVYEGQVEVTAKVNGEPKTLILGSADRPLRWVGFDPSAGDAPPEQGENVVDWDVDSQAWVKTR